MLHHGFSFVVCSNPIYALAPQPRHFFWPIFVLRPDGKRLHRTVYSRAQQPSFAMELEVETRKVPAGRHMNRLFYGY
jgi:hypothetical protein